MTIQPVTATNSLNPTFSQSQADKNLSQGYDELLTPEVLNELNKAQEDKNQATRERIEDTYSTAKNIDLAKSYVSQQQAVIDAYMQSIQGEPASISVSNSNSSDSTVKSLTEMYAALYEHRQNQSQTPVTLPSDQPASIQPVSDTVDVSANQQLEEPMLVRDEKANSQMHAYNNVMMPSASSYMHLSA